MNYTFSRAGLGCCLCPQCSLAARGTEVTCAKEMGHGTPDNMSRAGLLQVSESKARVIHSGGTSEWCLFV